MNIEEIDYHDWIEKSIDGELTEEENREFQKMLLTNLEFSKQYMFRIKLSDNWSKAKKYGETRLSVAEIAKKVNAEKKNRLVVLSIAASVLVLISISGVLMFSTLNKTDRNFARNTDSIEPTIIPQMKHPEEKASIHIYGKLKLLSPINNILCNRADTIIFTWESNVDAETNIVIENQANGDTIYREKINVNAQKFVLKKNTIPEGEYLWSIEGFREKEKFKVGSGN